MSKYYAESIQSLNSTQSALIKLPRFRTIKETMEELKVLDPSTALTIYHIRCLCSENKIKTITTGKKILVDFESLLNYLKGE